MDRAALTDGDALIHRRTVLGSLALGLLAPCIAEAQPVDAMPRIGMLRPDSPDNPVDRAIVNAFRSGLHEAGLEDGSNVRLDVRYAQGKLDRLAEIAREFAAIPARVIVTANPYSSRAARGATNTVPIVVALDYETDPVAAGWVASLARPAGNLTGMFLDQPEMSAKLLQLLRECVPGLTRVAVLWDQLVARAQFDATVMAAKASGVSVISFAVSRAEDLGGAFEAMVRDRVNGLIVLTSPLFTQRETRVEIADLARKNGLPAITLFTTFPSFGLLLAYGPDQLDAYRRVASDYVPRILKGARTADLPIQRPEKFRLVINTKTAKSLKILLPPSLVLQADELIR